jgi:hypothetical protein
MHPVDFESDIVYHEIGKWGNGINQTENKS